MAKSTTSVVENIPQEFVQYSSREGKQILYHPCSLVEDIHSPDVQQLIQQMKKCLKNKGIGLAANQIGKPFQIFIIEYYPDTERYDYLKLPAVPFQVFINPKITAVSEEKIAFWHGCLSASGWPRGLVATYQWIEYEAYDENGILKTGRLDGLGAVIFQHEFRHLLGSLYIDHAKYFIRLDELRYLFELKKLIPYEPADENVPLLLADYVIGNVIGI